jgi:carboxypeptidase Q
MVPVRTRVRPSHVLLVALLAAAPAAGQVATSTGEKVDYDAIYKIKDEGFQRSQVMDTASWLTDVYGPRLTGSPSFKAAADWAVKKLTEWGAANARTEAWGTFGRGWVNERFSATVVSGAQPWVLTGTPKAWTPGIEGTITADVVFAPMENEADLEKWKGKLKGKIVLPLPTREVKAHFEPQASRMTDVDLEKLLKFEPTATPRRNYNMASVGFMVKRLEFLQAEGVLAVFEPGRGDGGTIFVQQGGAYNPKGQQGFMRLPAVVPPQVVIPVEHYGRLVRTLERKMPVSVEVTIRNTMTEDQEGMNVFAELPGTDKADEVVMLGAHFDGWHGGTGATDNAAGSAVMLEAFRILKASGVKLRRTVRLGLWGGEEQGLIGSREYVKATFADRATMQLKPAHGKIAGYFNVDNGTGAIRGVYLQGNEAVTPVFTAWMQPFDNLGMKTLSIQNTGGTDHLSFDAVGIPGFQFIQDEIEYDTRTHHSNMDVWERLQAGDMMKNAVIVASFVYHAANRDQMLPRKPLPKPQPPQTPPATPARQTTQN